MKNQKITLNIENVNQKVKEIIFERWYDKNYGVRPLNRAIETLILNPLALEIINWNIVEWDNLKINLDKNNNIIFEKIK